MLRYAAIFLIISIVAFMLGFLGYFVMGGITFIAQVCFYIFLALFVVFLGIDVYQRHNKKKK